MADIKTRDVVKGTIKKIDKAAIAADRMRSAYVQTKEKAEHTTHPDEHNAEEYASDRVEGGVDRITHEAAHQFDKQGRKGLEETKRNVSKAKDGVQKFREKRATESIKRQTVRTSGNKTIKAVEQTEKTIKQSASSAGKKTIKTAGKGTAKAAQRSVKTTKTTIKTTQQAAKAAQKTAQATVKASQKAAQAAKATAKATVAGVKAAVKATIAAVKAIIAATKALVAAIAAGGWVAVAVIVVICLIALICGSVFGIFFSGEDSGTGMSMQTAVQEINADYDAKMEAEKNSVAYDNMEISGGRAVWKDVLAVYAVKTNTDKDNPQEVATMDESKKQILSDIFWEMNSISSRSESHSETEITETDDGNGNIVQTETTVTKTTLYITVSHLTVDEMADLYGFDAEQREYLAELLKDKNNSLWAAVLYGIKDSTFKNYIYMYELFVKPSFGKNRLVQVKKSDVRKFYNSLADGKVLKIATIDNVHNVLHQVFQVAVDDGMIRQNPTDNMLKELKLSHGFEREKKEALTVAQQKLFFDYMLSHPKDTHWYPVFYVMANTGMRVGEITGLRWSDIDLKKGIIRVNHTLVYYNHRDEKGCYFSINTPKTKAGEREIPMTEGVKQAFLMEREFQSQAEISSKSRVDGYDDFIFVNRYGDVQNQGNLNKALRRMMRDCNDEILEKYGADSDPVLLPQFSCHILRHTFATRLCESGANLKFIQSILGHADVSTTMNIYVDVTDALKKKEITAFDDYMTTKLET